MHSIPEGFTEFPKDGSYQDTIAPFYCKKTDTGLMYGLRVEKHHCNGTGICHGATFMALMDLAMISGVCHAMGVYMGTPTITLNMHFMLLAKPGDWIEVHLNPATLKSTMGFIEGNIQNQRGETPVHASGVFKLPSLEKRDQGIPVSDVEKMLTP